jgi:hypothetical protein
VPGFCCKLNGRSLNDQFKSVFTKSTSATLEKSTIDRGFNIKTLKIGEQGVFKLLKDINPSKATGLDQIPNILLKTCAKTLAPGMTKIFQKSIDYGELKKVVLFQVCKDMFAYYMLQ